ncbi:MAG TPA: TraV family lipoprotein [Thiohalobacter sp.]|nr:TraV family lipoprotein [Thiohalobacter sp.]
MSPNPDPNPLAWLALSASLLLTGGCAVFNPYDEDPICQLKDDLGRCIDVEGAYASSLAREQARAGEPTGPAPAAEGAQTSGSPGDGLEPLPAAGADPELRYRRALYSTLGELIEQPRAPLLSEPVVKRALLIGYDDDGVYFTSRFAYILLEQPRFLLDEMTPPAEVSPMFHPFTEEEK